MSSFLGTDRRGGCGCMSRSLYNILAVGLAFAVLFSAYNPLQNYVSSLVPGSLGQQSLAVLYTVCALSVFAAPAITDAWGPKLTMIFGAACYVVYMLSLTDLAAPLVLSASAVIGFGSALLWVAVGVFVTQNSTPATYGFNSGLFWAVFQLNAIVGNLVTWAVFPSLSSTTALYLGFAVVAAAGTLSLLFLRAPRADAAPVRGAAQGLLLELAAEEAAARAAEKRLASRDAAGRGGRGVLGTLADAGRGACRAAALMKRLDMLLLLPVFFFSGAELAFWTGEFTQELNVNSIGLVLALAGVGEVRGCGRVAVVAAAPLVVTCDARRHMLRGILRDPTHQLSHLHSLTHRSLGASRWGASRTAAAARRCCLQWSSTRWAWGSRVSFTPTPRPLPREFFSVARRSLRLARRSALGSQTQRSMLHRTPCAGSSLATQLDPQPAAGRSATSLSATMRVASPMKPTTATLRRCSQPRQLQPRHRAWGRLPCFS